MCTALALAAGLGLVSFGDPLGAVARDCRPTDAPPRRNGSQLGENARAPEAEASAPPGAADALDPLDQWAQWRGPLGTGRAPNANPPLEWSEAKNLRWKAALPGLGHSSPIVWGDRVFVTSAEPIGDAFEPLPETAPGAHDNLRVSRRWRYLALCFDRESGRELWRRTLLEAIPHEGGHTTGSYASASPVTDGESLFVSFGSRGLFRLDFDGSVFWKYEPVVLQTKHGHGEGSSPTWFDGRLFVVQDHEGASSLVALDAESGEELWTVERDEPTSWSSPIVFEHDGRAQLVVSATGALRAYSPTDGRVLWSCGGLSHNVVATPIMADGMVFAGSSYEKQAFLAIRLDGAEGALERTDRLAWYRRRGTPYVPSPLYADGVLWLLNHYQGFLARVDAATGRDLGRPLRLAGIDDVYASLVGAGEHLFVVDRDGSTAVLAREEPPRIVARNVLEDRFSATPALAGEDLFLRGERYLYCLSRRDEVRTEDPEAARSREADWR